MAVAVAGQRLLPFSGRMTALFLALLASLRATTRSRLELAAEILALRHQLAVLQRTTPKRPRLRPIDRLLWVLLSSVWPNWRRAVQIVTPATVVRWHRRAFAAYWRWNSRPRRVGRPALAADLRALIRQMRAANPLWGAPRIHGELQKLGIEVSQATVAKYLGRRTWSPVPVVAHLPRQSRLRARLDRLLHGPHRHVPRVVCVRGAVSRSTPHRPRERHGASDRGVDRATAPRGVAVGHRARASSSGIVMRFTDRILGVPCSTWASKTC